MESFLSSGHEFFCHGMQAPEHGKFLFLQKNKLKKKLSTGNSEINNTNLYLAFCCQVNLDYHVTHFLDLHQASWKILLLGGCDLWCFNMRWFFLDLVVIIQFLQFGDLPYEFCGHISVWSLTFGVGHQGLSLFISLQMHEEFALDTAEIPQYTRLSLGKKLNFFPIIVKPFKKVVFLELVDRSSVVQMTRSED